jgi:hypothetical protein
MSKRESLCAQICLCLVVMLLTFTALTAGAQKATVNSHNVKPLVVAAYKQYFGLDVPFPPIVENRSDAMGRYWTSVVYKEPLRYRLYVQDDGTVLPFVGPAKEPKGTFRVAVVAIDHGNTNIASLLDNLWVDVQQEINHNYAGYAYSVGYDQPFVQFANTNFLASSSEITNPRSSSDLISFVHGKGYSVGDFDIYVSLDLNAQNPAGGFAYYGGNFVYMGYYYAPTDFADLSQLSANRKSVLFWIGKAIYDHECGHIFGWEHEWTITKGQSKPGAAITDPCLYGWTDTDGDGIPEILSPTAYGMRKIQ